ncbi:MAG: hypothetical protein JWP89_5754 [Schlesneria sp.]|nr:hypothetical protein [Schlesneria sp.]
MISLRFPNVMSRVLVNASAMTLAVGFGFGLTAVAQPPLVPPPLRDPEPPVNIGPNFASPIPRASTVVPPMSIAPAPGYNPPMAVYPSTVRAFDGRPVYVGPPAYGPVYGPPNSRRPVGLAPGVLAYPPRPVPIASSNPSTITTFSQGNAPSPGYPLAPQAIEVRRTAGPANLRFSVGETFLNRVIAQERVEPGPVRDNVLGAEITGRQTTISRLRVDLLPSNEQARISLLLNGDVQTLTTGVTPQAMIDTAGQQQFSAMKDVYFDGEKFSTRHATVYIRANNQTIGAKTAFSGTMFGGLADMIAYRVAERQKAAGEAVARDRLAERLFPTFDGEVDGKLAQANRQLEPIRRWLDSVKLLPSTQTVWTTDSQLTYEGFVGDDKTASTLAPVDQVDGDTGPRLSMHESLVNTFISRTGLKGLKTTDKKLRELEKSFLSAAGQAVPADDETAGGSNVLVPPGGTEGIVTDIIFDEVDPLTVRYERDQVLVTIKAEFKPAGQALVPPMTVTIPYQMQVTGNKIRLIGGTPRVVAQNRVDANAPPTIIEKAIQKIIEADLIPLEFDRALPASLWKAAGPAPRIAALKSDNGWLTITAE